MKFMEIKKLISDIGAPITIQFTEEIQNYECGFNPDPLMKAKLIRITKDNECEENTYKLMFNATGFEDFNKLVARADYYDKNHIACLTCFESGWYPENGMFDFYYDDMEEDFDVFNIIDDVKNPILVIEEFEYWINNSVKEMTKLCDNDNISGA